MRPLTDVELFASSAHCCRNLNRHLASRRGCRGAVGRGHDFAGDDGLAWAAEQSKVQAVQAAFR
jgi:hypothetical protein